MSKFFGRIVDFARTQGTQPSTWRGLVMVFGALGVSIRPDVAAAVTAIAMGVSGLIGILGGPDAPVVPPAE